MASDKTDLSWRSAAVFISSTFQDMQSERDCIQREIIPYVQSVFNPYYIEIRAVDLRWGITTDNINIVNDKEKKILKICFDEIDKSRPFFIGLIGYRYGWIPDYKYFEEINPKLARLSQGTTSSVTEMEMLYGALNNEQDALHSIFCLRDRVKDSFNYDVYCEKICSQKDINLTQLRKIIKQRIPDDRWFEYSADYSQQKGIYNLEKFKTLLSSLLIKELSESFGVDLHKPYVPVDNSTLLIEENLQYCNKNNRFFVAREEEVQFLEDCIDKNQSCIVKGMRQSGKSALLSYVAERLKGKYTVLYHNAALSCDTFSASQMLDMWIKQLSDLLNMPYKETEEESSYAYVLNRAAVTDNSAMKAEQTFKELCRKWIEQGNKTVIIIDAIDKLQSERYNTQWMFLPSDAVAVVSYNNYNATLPEGIKVLDLKPMNQNQGERFVKKYFAYHCKELHGSVLKALTERCIVRDTQTKEKYCNILWLKTAIHWLMNMDKDDFKAVLDIKASNEEQKIEYYFLQLINQMPQTAEELFCLLIEKASKTFGKELCDKTVKILICSKYGLRKKDYEKLLKENWDTLQFASFFRWLSPFVAESVNQKLIALMYGGFLQALTGSFKDGLQSVHADIADLLWSYNAKDPVRIREAFYQNMKAMRYDRCAELVTGSSKTDIAYIKHALCELTPAELQNVVCNIIKNG
ncbi:MAG: DUF4062 domain-containing protein [Bacteroidales bacterium]|nr:DUF4062 domain-containing protein [Bacteroidales bacterium]